MPSNNITLSSSIRQNLLSLQNTTRLLDLTSNRLSTGLKVNSALDDPAAFFAARSLTNRASDLSIRKNGIGQAVSLLQSTDKSLTAITSLVEQAKAKATEADEAATAGVTSISTKQAITVAGTTKLSTNFPTSGVTALVDTLVTTGLATATDELIATVNGQANTLIVTATTLLSSLVTFFSDLNSITATFNTLTKQIDITAAGGTTLVLADATGDAGFFGVGELAASANDLFKPDGGTGVIGGATVTFATKGDATDLLTPTFTLADAATIITTVTGPGDAGDSATTFDTESGNTAVASTISELVASINTADSVLTATFNTTTSKIDIKAAEGVVVDFSGSGFNNILLTANNGSSITTGDDVTFTNFGSANEVAALTTDFKTLLDQINGLITDASYKGTNLLKASTSLDVKFDPTGDSKLTILGKALEKDGDGILVGLKFSKANTDYDFQTAGRITDALTDVDAAITELRTITSTFSTSLGVMQTREDFTTELVNALENGAAKLVNANLEEESAKLLALQTRQAIGVQALAISNNSQQSILALFR